ncbi:hypothetical protein ACFO5Q_17080, partial [Kordiimonas lipolytica]
LIGGDGADTFFFGNNHGNDVVDDFDTAFDTLYLVNTNTDFTSIDDVLAASQETTAGGEDGVLIDTGDGSSVFLVGLTLSDLQSATLDL